MKVPMQDIFYTAGMGFFFFLYLVLLPRNDLASNFYTEDFYFRTFMMHRMLDVVLWNP